mgnify:CR=1 FL=1
MNYIALALYAVTAVAGAAFGVKMTADHYKARIADMQLAQEHAQAEAHAHVAQVIQDQDKTTARVSNEYEAKLADLRRRYAGLQRVHIGTTSASNLPAAADSTGRADAASPDAVPAGQCAETTLMLQQLQEWVRSQGMEGVTAAR